MGMMKNSLRFFLTLAFIALCAVGIKLNWQEAEVSAKLPTDWGVVYSKNGEQPVGNATREFLEKYDAYFVGDESDKNVYLTFNAGYENGFTPKILDVLKAQDVKATFFLVGNVLTKHPDLVKRMVDEGHMVCNHTMGHPNIANLSDPEAFAAELDKWEKAYTKIIGKPSPKYYRPPSLQLYEYNLKQAKALGYKTIFFSIAYKDWDNDRQPDPAQSVELLQTRAHNGAVVLLHSTSKTNADILEELITSYRGMGYNFASLDELTGG